MTGDLPFNVLTSYSEVTPFLPAVVSAADKNKHALGFFPGSVFTDFARRELLFVLSSVEKTGQEYAGHLLFDVTFPKAHVRQIHVQTRHRGQGLGKLLLSTLKAQLTALQYISINARVAEDLVDANAFWETQGFYPQRVAVGGKVKKRTIVVRAHELQTPQLFHSSGISSVNPLGLDFKDEDSRPLFLLDLNVLFDLGPRRSRHENAIAVFRAERTQSCALAISSEIDAELKRTTHKGKTDPMQALARALPKYAVPPAEYCDVICPELAALIFPDRASKHTLTENDLSDVRHLATAIFHGLQGLITSDSAILSCAVPLRRRYGIEVTSPESFQDDSEEAATYETQRTNAEETLSLSVAADGDEPRITEILRKLDVSASAMASRWAAVDGRTVSVHRVVARVNDEIIGYLAWSKSLTHGVLLGNLAVAESNSEAEDTVRTLLNYIEEQADSDVSRIRLHCPARQVVVREVASTYGYTSSSSHRDLQRIRVKGIVSAESWSSVRDQLIATCELVLPSVVPTFVHIDQQISVRRPDGELALVSMFRLETLLAPALFTLTGRRGVLVPVKSQYAQQLLDHSQQLSLLPKPRAQLHRRRHYLSGPATLKNFSRGDLIFFYESGGRNGASAVVALGRVLQVYQRDKKLIGREDLGPSVLESNLLDEIGKAEFKTITVFDNIIKIPHPVSIDYLRNLKCGEAHQLLTSNRLSSEQVRSILQCGFEKR